MASRRCFLTAIAVLALAILLVAMTAAGGPAQAVADALLIDTDTNVAFGNISGEDSRTMKRPLNVTRTAGGKSTDVGRREEKASLQDAIDATSTTEAEAHQIEGGAGEGRGKRARKAPKPFGEN